MVKVKAQRIIYATYLIPPSQDVSGNCTFQIPYEFYMYQLPAVACVYQLDMTLMSWLCRKTCFLGKVRTLFKIRVQKRLPRVLSVYWFRLYWFQVVCIFGMDTSYLFIFYITHLIFAQISSQYWILLASLFTTSGWSLTFFSKTRRLRPLKIFDIW